MNTLTKEDIILAKLDLLHKEVVLQGRMLQSIAEEVDTRKRSAGSMQKQAMQMKNMILKNPIIQQNPMLKEMFASIPLGGENVTEEGGSDGS